MSEDRAEGRVVGRYRLHHRLGQGGMGSVYLASAQGPGGFEKLVALKVLGAAMGNDEQFVRMFLDEARLSARIAHPNVCTTFDFGESEGTYYLAMEHLLGEPLKVVAEARPPYELVARMVADAARGLHAAHELADEAGKPIGLVHRDVSPQNIVVLYDGVTKVVDFGIAKARDRLTETASGSLKGTLAYMAPEQLEGRDTDRRSDVFALGIVLWETTLGWPLFKRASQSSTIKAVLHDPLLAPHSVEEAYPPELEAVVTRALERDPDLRFQSMEAMADALDACVESIGRPAGAAQVSQWMRKEFADRLAERTALLRAGPEDGGRGAGEESGGLPAWKGSATPASVGRPGSTARGRANRPLALLALVAGLAASAGVGAWLASAHPSAGSEAGASLSASLSQGAPAADADPGRPTPDRTRDAAEGAPVTDEPAPDGGRQEPEGGPGSAGEATAGAGADAGPDRAPPPPRARPGYANIVSIPAAEVYAGSRRLGSTPLSRVELAPGRHQLELRVPDLGLSRRVGVRVRSGEVSYVSVRLEP